MTFATWMDLEIIIISEVSQTERDKYHVIPLLCVCGIFKRMIQVKKRDAETNLKT